MQLKSFLACISLYGILLFTQATVEEPPRVQEIKTEISEDPYQDYGELQLTTTYVRSKDRALSLKTIHY